MKNPLLRLLLLLTAGASGMASASAQPRMAHPASQMPSLTTSAQATTLQPAPCRHSAKDAAPRRMLMSKTWYGDAMGNASADLDMKKEIYFYGYDGQLNAIGNYGRNYGESGEGGGSSNTPGWYVPTYYTRNARDARGNIVRAMRYQYGQYDYGDMAWKLMREYAYEYDELGRLVKDSIDNYKTTYCYDEAGNMVKDTVYYASNGGYMCDRQYLDFIAPGLPTTVISNGKWSADQYTAFIEYDENGNKTSEYRCKLTQGDGEMPAYVGKQVETWTYEGDVLVLYEKDTFKSSTGEAVPYLKITYEPVDGDTNQMLAKEYSYDNIQEKWFGKSQSCLYSYAYPEEWLEQTRTEVSVSKAADAVNDVCVRWSVPELSKQAVAADYIVFRDGEPLDTLTHGECLDADPNFCTFTDRIVKSGRHAYFVLPRFLLGSGPEGHNAPMEMLFASDIVEIDASIDLPAVSDVRLKGGYVKREGSGLDVYDTTHGVITWTNPENTAELGFISNDLMLDKFQLPEAVTTEALDTELDGMFYKDETDVYVLTRYAYGKAFSEHCTVRMSDLTGLVGIDAARRMAGVAIDAEGRRIRLEGAQKATVCNAEGRSVAASSDGEIDLSPLTPGCYILLTEQDGQLKGYKFLLR